MTARASKVGQAIAATKTKHSHCKHVAAFWAAFLIQGSERGKQMEAKKRKVG